METSRQLIYYSSHRSPLGLVGWAAIDHNSRWQFAGRRTLEHYSATYILRGRCHYMDDLGRDRMFGPGDLLFCFPGIAHRFEAPKGEQFSEFWTSFDGPAFDLWRELNILDPENFSLHVDPVDYWLGRFENLFNELRTQPDNQLVAVCGLQTLLAEMMRFQDKSAADRDDQQWVGQAKALLDAVENAQDLDLEQIARALSMSYSSFRRRFVALSGMPPRRYHTSKLMERACQWMLEAGITNREIAERCGFSTEFHFSERFKQIMGIPPREFRSRLRKNHALAANVDNEPL